MNCLRLCDRTWRADRSTRLSQALSHFSPLLAALCELPHTAGLPLADKASGRDSEEVASTGKASSAASLEAEAEFHWYAQDNRSGSTASLMVRQIDLYTIPLSMSSETEVTEIIRRCLLEWGGLPDEARKTVREYAAWATDHAGELDGLSGEDIIERFESCYPFHPQLISVFQRKWQSLPRFQPTRGVLRLLALWVAWAYQSVPAGTVAYSHMTERSLATLLGAQNAHHCNRSCDCSFAWIFWPARIAATGEERAAGHDVPGLGIHKLEPVW
jgi:hypothetical protein